MIAWHKMDLENRMYCNLLDGKKISMPRYYKDKLYEEVEREIIREAIKEKQNVAYWKKIAEWDVNPALQRDRLRGIDAAKRKMEVESTKNEKL